MSDDRVFPVGTQFEVLKPHQEFAKGWTFEITDHFRNGTAFFKYRNPPGSARPFHPRPCRTTQAALNALLRDGVITTSKKEDVAPEASDEIEALTGNLPQKDDRAARKPDAAS